MQVRKIESFRSRRKKQVAAYIRVSTTMAKQDESYENQERYYREKICSNPDWEFAGIYGEQVSGTHSANRDSFQQMIADALMGKIDLILCKSVSRWARNTVDGLSAIKILTGNGIHVLFEQEGFDTRMPGVILPLNLAQSAAQAESESISENMKWHYRNRTAQGRFWARKGMYFGYEAQGDDFTPNDDARFVSFMFERFLAGDSLKTIAEKLNGKGARTRKGNSWTDRAVRSILTNEVYVGDVIFQKKPSRNVITGKVDAEWQPRYVKDHHTPIISREIWDAAQAKLKKPERDTKGEVLALLGAGYDTPKKIAARMEVAPGVVAGCLKRLKAKGRLVNEHRKWSLKG